MSRVLGNLQESHGSPSEQGTRSALLLTICHEFEQNLRAGLEIHCEQIFDKHPWLVEDSELALDLVYTEFNVRRELGAHPTQEEYFCRFPQWRTQLRHQFRLDELLVDSPTLLEESRGESNDPTSVSASQRFHILGLLARGGIGQVTRALDTELDREVAVKSILPNLIGNCTVRERFLREAAITGRLEHPGIVPVYAMGVDANGSPFYAMRLIHGKNFQEAIQDYHSRNPSGHSYKSSEFLDLLRRFLSVCVTIAYAHSRGVIHRDIKPQNIMLGLFGETLVVDWGLAKVESTEPQSKDSKNSGPEASDSQTDSCIGSHPMPPVQNEDAANDSLVPRLTSELLIGTPAFMSPEQAMGQAHAVEPSSDIYSLGATLYMLLTGQNRFGNSDVNEILQRIVIEKFDRPRQFMRSVPRPLEAICMKALSLKPENRYSAALDMAADIERWLADEPVLADRESWTDRAARFGRQNRSAAMAGAVALVLIAVVSSLAAWRINNERLRAEQQRSQTEHMNARLALDRGIQLVAANETGAGVLWFDRALGQAPRQDADLRRVILSNLAFARLRLVNRVRTFTREHMDELALFSASGNRLMTCNRAGWITVFDVNSAAVILKWIMPETRVVGGHFAEDGNALIASSYPRGGLEIARLAIDRTDPAGALESPMAPAVQLAKSGKLGLISFSPDQSLVAAEIEIERRPSICVWSLPSGILRASIPVDSYLVDLGFLGPSKLVWVDEGRRAKVQSVDPVPQSGEPWIFGESIERLAIPKVGNQLFAITRNGSLSCWDHDSKSRVFTMPIHSHGVKSMHWNDDGSLIAIAGDSGVVHIWSTVDRSPACESLRMDHYVGILRFRPNSTELLVPDHRRVSSLWKVPRSEDYLTRFGQTSIRSAEFNAEGSALATASGPGVYIRDGMTGIRTCEAIKVGDQVNDTNFSPDGRTLLTACRDGSARTWNALTGRPTGIEILHRSSTGRAVSVTSALFSPSGDVIATCDTSGLIQFSSADENRLLGSTERVASAIISVAFKPDGKQIAASYTHPENSVQMWDVANGSLIWKASQTEPVRSVVVSPDGQLVLSAGNDHTARFWNALDGKAIGQIMQHRGQVFFAKFSPDGKTAVTGGYDANVRLWHVPTGKPAGSPMQHDSLVLDAVFSPDGTRLLTGSLDQTARLWDIQTCLPLSAPLKHTSTVSIVRFHPMRSIALTSSRLWQLPTPFPDDPELVTRWVRLATESTLNTNNSIDRIEPGQLEIERQEFYRHAGKQWDEW